MFIYHGIVAKYSKVDGVFSKTANGLAASDTVSIANSIAQSDIASMALTGVDDTTTSGIDNIQAAVALNAIYAANKPVFAAVFISPSQYLTTAVDALQSAITQMSQIHAKFTTCGMLHLLRGFAIDTFAPYLKYSSDGSRIDIGQLNYLVNVVHATYNLPCMVLVSDAIDAVSVTAPPSPRSNTPAAFIASPYLGKNGSLQDVLVTMNPVYPAHLEIPFDGTVDVTRALAALGAAKTNTSIIHAVYQGPPSPLTAYAADRCAGLLLSDTDKTALHSAKVFLNSLGFFSIALGADSDCGKTSNCFLDERAFPITTIMNTATLTSPLWASVSSANRQISVEFDEHRIVFDSSLALVS